MDALCLGPCILVPSLFCIPTASSYHPNTPERWMGTHYDGKLNMKSKTIKYQDRPKVESSAIILSSLLLFENYSKRFHPWQSWRFHDNVSSHNNVSKFWESEPMWTCKNINFIHDQGRRYHYLDDCFKKFHPNSIRRFVITEKAPTRAFS